MEILRETNLDIVQSISADQDGSRFVLAALFRFWTCFISYNFVWYRNLKASANQ